MSSFRSAFFTVAILCSQAFATGIDVTPDHITLSQGDRPLVVNPFLQGSSEYQSMMGLVKEGMFQLTPFQAPIKLVTGTDFQIDANGHGQDITYVGTMGFNGTPSCGNSGGSDYVFIPAFSSSFPVPADSNLVPLAANDGTDGSSNNPSTFDTFLTDSYLNSLSPSRTVAGPGPTGPGSYDWSYAIGLGDPNAPNLLAWGTIVTYHFNYVDDGNGNPLYVDCSASTARGPIHFTSTSSHVSTSVAFGVALQ